MQEYVSCSCSHKNVLMNTALRSVSKVPCICFLFVLWNGILLHVFCNIIYGKTQKGNVTMSFIGGWIHLLLNLIQKFKWECIGGDLVEYATQLWKCTLFLFSGVKPCEIFFDVKKCAYKYSNCMVPHNVVMGQERKYWILRHCLYQCDKYLCNLVYIASFHF